MRKINSKPRVALITASLLTLLLQPSAHAAEFDQQFYSGNDVLYYDPGTPCSSSDSSSMPGAAPGSIDVPLDFTLGNDDAMRPVNLLKELMADFNFTDFQAAGIVGNFMHESGGEHLPPNVNEFAYTGGGPGPPNFAGGYGWAQWTASRQVGFIDYAVENKYMESRNVDATDAANYAWLTFELTQTGESEAVPAVKATKDEKESARVFENVFERARIVANESRDQKATKVLNAYRDGGGVEGVGNTSDDTDTSSQTCDTQGSSTAIGASEIFGEIAWPISGNTKSNIEPYLIEKNGQQQWAYDHEGYTAHDITTTGLPKALAFASGTAVYTSVGGDKCGGDLVSIWNEEAGHTVSYLHLKGTISNGTKVSPGDHVGNIAPADGGGCGIEHLHLDVVNQKDRPGCKRNSCAEPEKFVDVGVDLFKLYQALPE